MNDPLSAASAIISPATPTEEQLSTIWEEITGISPISVTDTFSDLGGTSLMSEKMLLRIRERFGRSVSPALLADEPTLKELAERIDDEAREMFSSDASTSSLLNSDGHHPVFCIAGAGATAVSFLPLARFLEGEYSVWGFQAHGFHSRGLADHTLAAHARRHLKKVAEVQPTGRVLLIGHSFGGHVAIEMGRRLRKQGREVTVISWDTVLRGAGEHSVTEAATSTPSKPPFAERMRKHFQIYTAGLFFYDAQTQHEVFWEQALRIQNRVPVNFSVPPNTHVLITDQYEGIQSRWEEVGGNPILHRISGDHLGILTSGEVFNQTKSILESD